MILLYMRFSVHDNKMFRGACILYLKATASRKHLVKT